MTIAAGQVVTNDIIVNKDVTSAKWWLERKAPEEFGDKKITAVQVNIKTSLRKKERNMDFRKDFKYQRFIESNFLIKNKEGKVVPFILNKVQDQYMIDLDKTYGNELVGVRDIVLKAWKEGFSSLILAIFSTDFIMARDPIASVCISDTKDETQKLFNRAKFLLSPVFKRQSRP